ncbi:MAG: phosphate ABC transporter permease PstA, partial [Deltaproteobacteria bacterium]
MKRTPSQHIAWRYFRQKIFLSLVWLSAILVATIIVFIFAYIFINGINAISWDFITNQPTDMMTKGGIMPAIVGTIYLTCGAVLFAVPLGIASAIYLSEYASQGRIVRFIRIMVNCLAGVPSVVFGLFGLSFFVIYLNIGISILAGALTLACIVLPTIISASEEALKAVPQTFREASFALGISKWKTIFKIVLPTATPGIITGTILSIARVAGETAPIMFTAATFFTAELPKSIFSEVMALPYHIFVLATAGTNIEETRTIQYGT